MSRCGSNDTSHSGWRPNRTRLAGRELLPLAAPASGDVVDHDPHAADRTYSPAAEPPRDRAREHADREVPPPAEPRPAEPAPGRARRASTGSAVAGTRIPIDERSTACWPVTGIDGGIDVRRDADPRREPARDVRGRGQRRIALLLRIELAERRQVVVVERRRSAASPRTSHTIAVMLSVPPAARAAATSSAHRLGRRCAARTAAARSPDRRRARAGRRCTAARDRRARSSMIDSDGSTSSPTPSACRIAPPALRGLVRAVTGREQRRLQRLVARDLDERAGAQHVRARVPDGGDDRADRRRCPPPTASCPCRAARARGRAIAWTSWFATRAARRSRRANTSASRVAGRALHLAPHHLRRELGRDLAALDAAHAVAHDEQRAAVAGGGPRPRRARRAARRRDRRRGTWSSLCSRTWPTSLAAAISTSSGGCASAAAGGPDGDSAAGSVTSLAELDPQELIAHADVVAVLDRASAR